MDKHNTPFWRRRRYHLIAATIGALIIAAVGANLYLVQQYQPGGAVTAYLTAVQNNDAQAEWNVAEVQAPQGHVDAALLDLPALRRAIAQGAPDIKTFDVTTTRYLDSDQTSAAVSVTYETSAGSRQTTF
jgi:hypothetical protein